MLLYLALVKGSSKASSLIIKFSAIVFYVLFSGGINYSSL